MDGLNNVLACHLCTDVAVPYFTDDSDMEFGTRPPSLWFHLITGPLGGCFLELMGWGLLDNVQGLDY